MNHSSQPFSELLNPSQNPSEFLEWFHDELDAQLAIKSNFISESSSSFSTFLLEFSSKMNPKTFILTFLSVLMEPNDRASTDQNNKDANLSFSVFQMLLSIF